MLAAIVKKEKRTDRTNYISSENLEKETAKNPLKSRQK
jgi:hypothetical protein